MKPRAYFNEIDPKAVEWLRELIRCGHLPAGDVDDRSICDVQPEELKGYTQCHFFAGIGGWSLALRSAGWPDDRPVWTGSAPCQPFSVAGAGKGFDDERHLWPEFSRLIAGCCPVAIFGEQVAGKNGETWLDSVQADLENGGYTCGAVVTAACGFGAPHLRKRLYWVAHPTQQQRDGAGDGRTGRGDEYSDGRQPGSMAHPHRPGRIPPDSPGHCAPGGGPGATSGHWAECDWLPCRDHKSRPVEPGTFPLAYGVPARVGRLRGYGNAIVVPQAQAFIEAYMEVMG